MSTQGNLPRGSIPHDTQRLSRRFLFLLIYWTSSRERGQCIAASATAHAQLGAERPTLLRMRGVGASATGGT